MSGLLWSDDLTDAQLKMLMASGNEKYGVELRGGGWRTAGNLVGMGLGSIEGGVGNEMPGLFFANDEGVRILHEFDDEPDDFECPVCGGNDQRNHAHYI